MLYWHGIVWGLIVQTCVLRRIKLLELIFVQLLLYACMVITYSKSLDQPCKAANPDRGRKTNYSLSPFAPENLVSLDGYGSPVSCHPAHLHNQAESGACLKDSCRVPRRPLFIYLSRHTPSGQSRVYRVAPLRTDGVHCRESAGTGPVNLKIVPNGCCLGRSPWTN